MGSCGYIFPVDSQLPQLFANHSQAMHDAVDRIALRWVEGERKRRIASRRLDSMITLLNELV